MIEDLRLARLSLRDERVIKNLQNILANTLEFGLDLLAVFTDGADMFLRTFALLLLLDGGNYAPRSTSGADDILVSDREKVAFVDSEFAANL